MKIIEELIGLIKARQQEIAVSLAAGNAANWESYQRIVGHSRGLEESLELLNSLLRDEDEDE